MKKIAITQRILKQPNRNEVWDCLDQGWTTLFKGLQLIPVPVANQETDIENFCKLIGIDGIILSGGDTVVGAPGDQSGVFPERDKVEEALIAYSIAENIPLLGVCRGLQKIQKYFGGSLSLLDGHVNTSHQLKVKEISRLPLRDGMLVNSFHGIGIKAQDVPHALAIDACADDGTVEALHHTKHPIFGIMWHPERGTLLTENLQLLDSIFKKGLKP